MLFNSIDFVVFFVVVYAAYVVLQHRAQNSVLLVASYVFYAWWDWRFAALILTTTVVDFICARAISDSDSLGRRRLFLAISVVTDLSILGFFKYFNFFADSAIALLEQFGMQADPITLRIILPVGISFYTFQSMSYTIDAYRGHVRPTRNLLDYALYVSFFPQLVAGPIERAKHLLPQVEKPRKVTHQDLREGAWLILLGFFKKVVVADNLAIIANEVFNNPGEYNGLAVLLGVYAFAWQIYGDFSGYSNIARGTARLLGFDIMQNFRVPYFAENPQEFWRRWHISLSTWLRDYLYISLGGNKHGTLKTYRNLFLTMLLGGLWHGAAWNFVFWGAYQGVLLIVHRLAYGGRNLADGRPLWRRAVKIVVMFQFVCFGWVLFRINKIGDLTTLLGGMARWEWSQSIWALDILVLVLPLVLLHCLQERFNDMMFVKRFKPAWRFAIYMLLFAYILLWGRSDVKEFIYFQF